MKKKQTCPLCNSDTIRIDEYDAYACRQCCIWTEAACTDSDCYLCSRRPQFPTDVDWDDPWNNIND